MAQFTITPNAAARLAEIEGFPEYIAFKIDNGCCGGTTLLLMKAEYLGASDLFVGEVEGVGVYVERAFARGYTDDCYHFYVREGARESGFSIEIPLGFKFLMERGVGDSPPPAPSDFARRDLS